jgi:hypothetical protein
MPPTTLATVRLDEARRGRLGAALRPAEGGLAAMPVG